MHTEEAAYIDVVVVYDFAKPFGIHDNDFLTSLIEDFLLLYIFKRCSLNGSELPLWDNDCFDLYIAFNCNISGDKSGNKS